MADSTSSSGDAVARGPPPPAQPAATAASACSSCAASILPKFRLITEYDSEVARFAHKLSGQLSGGLAELRLSFQSGAGRPDGEGGGAVIAPVIGFLTRQFSAMYDVAGRNAVVSGNVEMGSAVLLRATYDLKDKKGEVSATTKLGHPSYQLEVTQQVPHKGVRKATAYFPIGEVSVEKKKHDKEGTSLSDTTLSLNGFMKFQLLDGIFAAHFKDGDLNLRYHYKDSELTFVPSILLPSNASSLSLKRRFGPCHKLSYSYNFDTDNWNAVYKHTMGKDFKAKAGYDSAKRLGWASFWVSEEKGESKATPRNAKFQFMLQVPDADIRLFHFVFRVQKRWDF